MYNVNSSMDGGPDRGEGGGGREPHSSMVHQGATETRGGGGGGKKVREYEYISKREYAGFKERGAAGF